MFIIFKMYIQLPLVIEGSIILMLKICKKKKENVFLKIF